MSELLKVDSEALFAAVTDLSAQHDHSQTTITDALAQIEQIIQQLNGLVPNVCEHMHAEKETIGKRATALLESFTDITNTLEEVANAAIPVHHRAIGAFGAVE